MVALVELQHQAFALLTGYFLRCLLQIEYTLFFALVSVVAIRSQNLLVLFAVLIKVFNQLKLSPPVPLVPPLLP